MSVRQSNQKIAEALFVGPRTAAAYVAAILAKLGVETRTAAVANALCDGLV